MERRIGLAVLAVLFPLSAWNQTASPAFEVASIKLHEFPPGITGLQIGGPSALQVSGNRVSTMGSLGMLVMGAYDLRLHMVSGEPDWRDREGNPMVFDIQAKAEGEGAVSQEQARLMLQRLLTDRFQLKLRREIRELPAYDLTVDKGGPKLKETAPGTEAKTTSKQAQGLWKASYTNLSMSDLVLRIASLFDRPLLDKTGLKGSYDFTLEYRRNVKNLADSSAVSMQSGGDTGPTIFTALQLVGLKVVQAKEPIAIVVIDHAEKPSEN
jgi:uncharacterized protein (TIGR03435 family)